MHTKGPSGPSHDVGLAERRHARNGIFATAFRDDRSSEAVLLTHLDYDGCEIVSHAEFKTGEHIRLHVRGQGWFDSIVAWSIGGRAEVYFDTNPRV